MLSNSVLDSTTVHYLRSYEADKDAIAQRRKTLLAPYEFISLQSMTPAEKAELSELDQRFKKAEAAHFAIYWNELTDPNNETYRLISDARKPFVQELRISETQRWLREFNQA